MTLAITHGHLLPCACGTAPDETWGANDDLAQVWWINCPGCLVGVQGATAPVAAWAWNSLMRKAEGWAA